MISPRRPTAIIVVTIAALALAACSGGEEADNKAGPGGRGSGPAQVGFVVVQPTSVPLVNQLSGRVTAFQTAEVRPQVNGVIRRRFFTEGGLVRQGQTLYEIDPSLYRAAVNEAQANVASARANAQATGIRADRLRPLAEMEAVAKQDYTDAVATAGQARASVSQTGAALETARINLRFTNVPAPISGRIGRSLFTVGALVTANQTEPLAAIQRLDPIFVDIQQSSAELLALRRSLAREGIAEASATVRLTLEDGSEYGPAGTVQFGEVTVDEGTGTVVLRARFPNPQGLLFPGMFVRATFAQAIDTRAFLVPQQAINRDPQGNATLYVVGPNNRALQRKVVAERTQGAFWVVTRGLNPGDRVITQGAGNLRPNAEIRAVPANTPQRVAPPQQGAGGNQASTGQPK